MIMSSETERCGVKNLGGFKREILRCAQNDKKSLLMALWYEGRTGKFFAHRCL
jgi:hypothetical protein